MYTYYIKLKQYKVLYEPFSGGKPCYIKRLSNWHLGHNFMKSSIYKYIKRDNSIAKFIQNRQYLASWLKSVAIQNWFRNVENSPKCYFKGFCMILRAIFTKCRTCNHKLPIIETGRWNNLINIERCFNIWWLILLHNAVYVMECLAFNFSP